MFKKWCLTINNPSFETEQALQNLVPSHANYVIYGDEHRGKKPEDLKETFKNKTG